MIQKNRFGPMAVTMILLLLVVLAAGFAVSSGENPDPGSLAGGSDTTYITDPEVLEQVWRDYLEVSVFTIQEGFEEPSQLSVEERIGYCWYSYRRAGGWEALTPLETKDEALSGMRILPAETMTELMERYFGLEVESFTGANPQYYFPGIRYRESEKDFLVAEEEDSPYLRDNPWGEENPWNIYFDAYRDNGDGTTTAVLTNREAPKTTPAHTRTITFGVREDGTLYWKGSDLLWPNSGRVKWKGNYEEVFLPLSPKELVEGNSFLVGQDETSLYFCRMDVVPFPDSASRKVTLYQVSQEDFVVSRKTTMTIDWYDDDGDLSNDGAILRSYDDGVLMLPPATIYRISFKLGAPERIPLPPFMAERVGAATGAAVRYDVSEDLTKFLYCDEKGVHLYQLEVPADELAERIKEAWWAAKAKTEYIGEPVVEGLDLLLLENAPVGSEDEDAPAVQTARFMKGDDAVLVTQDGTADVIISLAGETAPEEWVSEFSWLEGGEAAPLPEDEMLVRNWGGISVALLPDEGFLLEQGLERSGSYVRRGEITAFLARMPDPEEKGPKTFLYALRGEGMEESPKPILTVSGEGVWFQLVAVLEDGSCLCVYYAGPGECGFVRVWEK